MKYTEFRNSIKNSFFRITDVDFKLSGISSVQLSRWVKIGYLNQVKRGFYVFDDQKNSLDPLTISFLLYEPSYVSMERALSHYGLIPELVPAVTAISTRKTRTYKNQYGIFFYRSVRPELFFGYTPQNISNGGKYNLAEPEKALLDYIYFNHTRLVSRDDIDELRLNTEEFSKNINVQKLKKYMKVFDSKKVETTINLILQHVNA